MVAAPFWQVVVPMTTGCYLRRLLAGQGAAVTTMSWSETFLLKDVAARDRRLQKDVARCISFSLVEVTIFSAPALAPRAVAHGLHIRCHRGVMYTRFCMASLHSAHGCGCSLSRVVCLARGTRRARHRLRSSALCRNAVCCFPTARQHHPSNRWNASSRSAKPGTPSGSRASPAATSRTDPYPSAPGSLNTRVSSRRPSMTHNSRTPNAA